MGVRYTRPRSAGCGSHGTAVEPATGNAGREGGGARVHERPGGAARLGPFVPREGVPRRARPSGGRDGRGAREALGLHGRARLARPGHRRGGRWHRPLLRRDGRRRGGAGPSRRAGTPARHRHPVRADGPGGRHPRAAPALLVAGRLRRRHRDRGAGRPPAGMGPGRRDHDRRARRGWLGPARHEARPPGRRRDGRGRRHRPGRRGHRCVRRPRGRGRTGPRPLARREPAPLHRHARPGRRPRRPRSRGARQRGLDDRDHPRRCRRRPSRSRSRRSAPATRSSRWCSPTSRTASSSGCPSAPSRRSSTR